VRDQMAQATTAPREDFPERMAMTADEWLQEANEKEAEANDLRRRELALRTDITGLRSAARGMRQAVSERMEAAEKNGSILSNEQDQAESEPSPRGKR
jgi:predicted  nucleic acid-binding Zn-ribbon protein